MRKRLDAIADKTVRMILLEAMCYDALCICCSDKPFLSKECYEKIGLAMESTEDEESLFSIRASMRIIFEGLLCIPCLKYLCMLQRHKLEKLIKAEWG